MTPALGTALLLLLDGRDPALSEVFTPAEGTISMLLGAAVVAAVLSPGGVLLTLVALIGATI